MGPGTVEGTADRDEGRSAPRPSGRRLVVVPRQPGSLVPLRVGETGPKDDLDELVDEVFGPSTDERPGLFDALLLVGGGIVLAWAILSGAAVWIAAVAAVAMVLGLALPARSLVRRSRAAAASRRVRAAERRGYVLDITAGPTLGLARAYDDAVAAAGLPGSVYSGRALDAAHLAVVEVATLLKGDPPEGPAQDEYVTRRTAAIRALVGELMAANQRWLEERAATEAEEEDRRRRWVEAVTRARDELQAEDRMGSLAQLERITTRLSGEAVDVGA
jgi:hypothetical protein